MAEQTDKTDKIEQKNVRKRPGRKKGAVYQGQIRPVVMQVLVLRHLGWSIPATAQACGVGERSVFEWCKKHKDTFAELPAVQAAKDAIQCLVPEAVRVYQENLAITYTQLAYNVARDLLISNKVISDRKVIEDEREHSTSDLVSKAERIIAGVSNTPAGPRGTVSDPDGTSGT